MALGEDAMALSVVLEALAWTPDQPSLLEILGDLRNREEKVDAALRAWRDAFRQTPLDRIAEKIEEADRYYASHFGNADLFYKQGCDL